MNNSTYINIPDFGSPAWKSPVASAAALPTAGNVIGDARVTSDTSTIFMWNGSAWIGMAALVGGAVVSLNALTGALSLVAGSGISIAPFGSNITITDTGSPVVQNNLSNYIDKTSMEFAWDYLIPHYYSEILYTGSNVFQINYWDTPAKGTQLFTKAILYTGPNVSQVILTRIADSITLTKTIGYTGSSVTSITRA